MWRLFASWRVHSGLLTPRIVYIWIPLRAIRAGARCSWFKSGNYRAKIASLPAITVPRIGCCKIFWDFRRAVPVEVSMEPAGAEISTAEHWHEYYTRNDGSGGLPITEPEQGQEQSTTGQGPDAREGLRPCATCGEAFEPSKYCARKQKYCSYRCKRNGRISRRTSPHAGSLLHAVTPTVR